MENPGPALDHEDGEPSSILCPNCVFTNRPNAEFCVRCGAPLGLMATIDPLKSTFSEGFAYRQALDGPPRPIILAGIWLIFLPALTALPLSWAVNGFRLGSANGLSVGSFVGAAVVLYRATSNYLRKRKTPAPALDA